MTHQGKSITQEGKPEHPRYWNTEEKIAVYDYPDFFNAGKDEIIENRYAYKVHEQTPGDGTCYEFFFRDVHFWYGKLCLSQKDKLIIKNAAPLVKMNFSIQNHIRYSVIDQPQPFATFAHGQHNMMFLPYQTTHVECEPDEEIEYISITLEPEFLFRFLPDVHPVFQSFQESLKNNHPALISKQNLPITSAIMMLLHEILHCTHQGYFKRLFVEAKVIELILLQFAQCEQCNTHTGEQRLKEDDIKKMHLAKNILTHNIEAPLSLAELARQVGTNEYYLKKNFKMVFGTTVFGYLHQYRMEQSKKLLKQGDKKIAEVARRVGYKHATHFTAAFKKHFGFLPHQLKD